MQETSLTQASVNSLQFGKLFSRTVDAPFYASPLVVTNLSMPMGPRNVVYVATLGNTVYAFDADDPNASSPYWSVNLGTPIFRTGYYLGPTLGILSTPVIDPSTNTIYLTAIKDPGSPGLYVFALDLITGAFKFNSPRRITYTFPNGTIKTDATNWIQRAGLLLSNNLLYVATSNVWENDNSIATQEGFIQTFRADDLNQQVASFETTPNGAGGGIWQAGRGLAADLAGNVFVAMDSGAYTPPFSFGDSVVKFGPGSLTPASWFTPADWSFLYSNNLDLSANGVTLLPGTNLALAGGKAGVIYLMDQGNLGGLEPGAGNVPLQQFQAAPGCTISCGGHLPIAYWPHASNPLLYVWDVGDYLRSIPFDSTSQRFQTSNAAVGTLLPARAGGMTVSSNGSTDGTGIVWAATATQDPFNASVPGTLRAYNANDITQELYNSDQNSCRDAMGSFVKMAPPIVANGKVYVNTQSNVMPVYGLLSGVPPSPPPGTIHVTVNTSLVGPTITVDGGVPCTGSIEFDWLPGTPHTLTTSSPQTGIPNSAPHVGEPGMQFVWNFWSDGGAISHTVTPTSATTYTASFTKQYQLVTNVLPQGGGNITASPSAATGYYDSGTVVQLTAAAIPGCTFVNWTGALSGSINPQTVTMLTSQSVTANFHCIYSNTVLRVLPLGDSITFGVGDPNFGGYRTGLWNSFVANHNNIDFVGSLSSGPASLPDKDNEGHSGWKIEEIASITDSVLSAYRPDIILLLIGTNNIGPSYGPGTSASLSALLDQITHDSPNAYLFVSTLPPMNSGWNSEVQDFNMYLPGIVNSKVSQGKKVFLVDTYGVLTLADLADGVHPTVAGYAKMAAAWYSAIQSFVTASVLPPPPPVSARTIWDGTATPTVASSGDNNAIEVGLKFRSDVNASILGVRFYKGANNTGTHIGNLWTSAGTLLGTATFANETATGWQQVLFDSPIPVTANTTYVVSYFAPNGNYAADGSYFSAIGVCSPPLQALSSAAAGGNGVFSYRASSGFPNSTYQGYNYWVDVLLDAPGGAPLAPSPPTGLTATAGNGQVTLSWTAAAGAASYTVKQGRRLGGRTRPSHRRRRRARSVAD